ncbi:MAG: DUF4340 domain-containing protein [Planctomycetes bacterium]|nr:DUF4340 domain-containing protein [Planctomycetota bacterium]
MTESSKTGIIAAIAAVSTFLAWTTTTRNYSTGPSSATARINQPLFEKFADPLTAASLKIMKYDSDAEQYEEFEVAKDRNGVWTIPSHENYPADANKQMSEAANLFVGLKALNIASEKRDEHKMFGVLEPDKKKEAEGGDGVGELVQFRDEKGDILADLIIGKVDATDTKKRFVRIPSEDVIYVVELNTNPLSTDFKQWIESDLLKLSSNDIEGIGIRNYSLVKTGQGTLGLSQNYDADLNFNVRDGKWQPTNLVVYDGRVAKPRELDPAEEVNATKLNDMKSALDNLRIVNVAKKPAGVAADLRGEKLQESTLQALQRRGFFASQTSGTDSYELFAMNGDLEVTLKDGVQYLLRFGNGAGASFEPVEAEETKEGEAPKEVSINRFLLVTTRLDESKFPPTDLERVPETVEELKAMEAAKKAALQPVAPSNPTDPLSTEPSTAEPGATEPSVTEPGSSEAGKTDTAKPKGDAAAEGKPAGEEPVKDPVTQSQELTRLARLVSFQDPAPPAELSDEEWKERLEAERERITKENQRKIDQRNDRMAVAKKRVAELNARFADWYYIVSDSEFKRLKIELADLITKKGVGLPVPPPSGLPGSVPGLNIPGLSDQ